MFSREFLRKSSQLARRVPANQRTCARTLFKQSEGSDSLPVGASLSRSSFGGSNNGDHKSGDALLKFLLRSVASGVVIIGSSLSFSYWYPSLVDKCSFVSFADSADDAAWVSTDDLLPHKKKKRFLFGDSYRRRVFFNYEKRIRLQSPPEKVCRSFRNGIFSLYLCQHPITRNIGDSIHCSNMSKFKFLSTSHLFKTPDGEVLMTPEDLMRAVVPVFPPSDDGLISFSEYIFFVTLLSIPESSFSVAFKMFDLDNNGFLRLEFTHYDYRSCGTISAKDFALSLVASADISHISKLLDRVDEVSNEPHIKDIRITFEEFKNFAELRRQLQYLSLAIFSYGKVNGVLAKKDFQRASSQVCGISITDDLADIIFHVFDANRDGNLSSDEFVRVLQGRETAGCIPREPGLKGLMSCCADCTKNYSSAKRLL
ncbi:hypothetical protein OIU77_005709 [Salix suchowensis]|uniref:EF-hand domain-containing protein n=1 Tax=Salix suchowensis TaxID=1278906 RepID=A0ABQ9AT00_9ROSI|nr:hypothetical protein OIU77_005709 [Salix suchowensis]